MKVQKTIWKIALFCELSQESGHMFENLDIQLAVGDVDVPEWKEQMSNTWWIVSQGKLIFEAYGKWDCVKAKLEGTIVRASTYINRILAGCESKPEWSYDV